MRPAEARKILWEALAVAIVGASLSFAANALSPRGLALGRNYFPTGVATTNPPARHDGAADDPVAARLKGKGLVGIGRDEAQRRLGEAAAVFVDARDEEKFEQGHIPGAYELDPYHPERTVGKVLGACQAAEKVVVYCAGGECEDADTVALMLRDAGVADERLEVYGGGMDDWSAQHKPVEKGARP